MTCLRTPHLSSFLLSAVAAALAGCGGSTDGFSTDNGGSSQRNGPTTTNPSPTDPPPTTTEPNVDPPPEVPEQPEVPMTACVDSPNDYYASLTAGLNPVTRTDYVGAFANQYTVNELGETEAMAGEAESAGVACASASDPMTCLAALDSLTLTFPETEWSSAYYFVVTDASGARTLTTLADVKNFLGTIDTPNEAALLFHLGGDYVPCGDIEATDDGYATTVTRYGNCGVSDYEYRVEVSRNGTVSEEFLREVPSNCAIGRLADGICIEPSDPHAAGNLPSYLAEVCHLETAAVGAFVRLAAELQEHGAPERLIAGAHRAAAEEIGHARMTFELALRHGARPFPVASKPRATRSLLAIAIENASEGCVRETYGAACAHWQAARARSADLRRTWQRIAIEETHHAEWSHELAAWLMSHLTPEEQAEVRAAKARAVAELERAVETEPAEDLVREAGVPSATQARELLRQVRPLLAA